MRKENLKFIFIIILALVLRLVNINQSFWLDEAAQVIESSRSLLQQFDLAVDFHPPLYHILLHFWMQVDKSEIWVRLLSVGLGITSIVILYNFAKSLVNKKIAFITGLFLAISPYHLWYSQEARPYMAFLFFSLLSTYFLLQKKWIRYTIALIFSLYTHYFTLFLLIGHIAHVFFFQKKYRKDFLISSVFALATFAFWMPELFKQFTVGTKGLFTGWANVVSVSPARTFLLTFAKFIFGRGSIDNNYLYAVLVLPVFLLFIFSLVRIWKLKAGKILILLFFTPFVISEIVSLFIPIIAPQRLIFLLPLFYLILAYGIYNFPRKFQLLAILVVIFTSLGGIYQYFTDANVQREQWREAVAFTEQQNSSQNVALFVFPGPFAPYIWYSNKIIDAWGIAPKFIVTDEDLQILSDRLQIKGKVYLYQYLTGLTDPTGKTRNFLSSQGFIPSGIKNFPGVGFIYIYYRQ